MIFPLMSLIVLGLIFYVFCSDIGEEEDKVSKQMFVLELAQEGAYGDFHQREIIAVAVSDSESKLIDFWLSLEIAEEREGLVFRKLEEDIYIDFHISPIDVI